MHARKQDDTDNAVAAWRAQLGAWLGEWQIEQSLVEPRPPEASLDAEEPGRAPRWPIAPLDAEPPPACGQIRLLSPEIAVARLRPIFLAILVSEDGGGVAAAPFSRFSVPALPGELRTGRDEMALRVLCVWNARSFPARALALSWLVDALSAEELGEITAVRANLLHGIALPDELRRRTGPPLCRADDPRSVYRFRQEAAMDRVVREASALYSARDIRELPRAAEDNDNAPYGRPPTDA